MQTCKLWEMRDEKVNVRLTSFVGCDSPAPVALVLQLWPGSQMLPIHGSAISLHDRVEEDFFFILFQRSCKGRFPCRSRPWTPPCPHSQNGGPVGGPGPTGLSSTKCRPHFENADKEGSRAWTSMETCPKLRADQYLFKNWDPSDVEHRLCSSRLASG